jgi:hypothetical protein
LLLPGAFPIVTRPCTNLDEHLRHKLALAANEPVGLEGPELVHVFKLKVVGEQAVPDVAHEDMEARGVKPAADGLEAGVTEHHAVHKDVRGVAAIDKKCTLVLARVGVHELYSVLKLGGDHFLSDEPLDELLAKQKAILGRLDAAGGAAGLHCYLKNHLANATADIKEDAVAVEGKTMRRESLIDLKLLLALVHVAAS